MTRGSFDADDDSWLEPLVALTSFEQPVLQQDLWDELRAHCRALGGSEGGDDACLAYRVRDVLDLLEAAESSMSEDDAGQDIIPTAPAVRPTWPKQSDAALLAWLLAREAFHLRNTIRQTSGRTRKLAFARLDQVKELLRRVGGPFPDA